VYSGTLINDLIAIVEKTERLSLTKPRDPAASISAADATTYEHAIKQQGSQSEQFAKPLSLSPTDRYLSLLLVVHAQLVRALEPGNDLADAVDIH